MTSASDPVDLITKSENVRKVREHNPVNDPPREKDIGLYKQIVKIVMP